MFIAHGEKFRKNIKWIMGLFAVAVSLSLVTFFTQTGGASRAANAGLPTIGGKPVDANVYQAARAALMAESIIDSGRELRRSPEVEDYLTQQAVVRLLMLRKAKELGLRVTDEECRNFIASQPVFHNEHGQFEPARYGQFAPFFVFLNNHGISLPEFEQLMRDRLTIRRLQEMVTASAVATPQEVNLVYTPLHERVTIELVSFSLNDYKQPITISNEEAQAFYDQNKETYRTPAQVKVRYAHFATAEEEKAVHVTDEEIAAYFERNKLRFAGTNSVAPELEAVKADVQKELVANRADRAAADRATEFSVRLVPKAAGAARPDFTAVSTEFAVKPQTTDFFSQLDKPVGATASVAFVQQAFAMTPDAPTSDPIPAPDGYYVIEYLDSKPSVIPTLDEVKDKVVDELKRLHAYEATVRQAQQTVEELKKLISPRTKLLYLCNPHIPTGRVMTREKLKAIADVAVDRKLRVMVDELWEDIIYDGRKHVTLASLNPEIEELTTTTWGISKTGGIPGVQLGYTATTNKKVCLTRVASTGFGGS